MYPDIEEKSTAGAHATVLLGVAPDYSPAEHSPGSSRALSSIWLALHIDGFLASKFETMDCGRGWRSHRRWEEGAASLGLATHLLCSQRRRPSQLDHPVPAPLSPSPTAIGSFPALQFLPAPHFLES
jgi:hypothetical protein